MTELLKNLKTRSTQIALRDLKPFAQDARGDVLIIFAITLTLIFGFCGLALDSANVYNTKSKLQAELDAAVLAGTSAAGDNTVKIATANSFLDKALAKHGMTTAVLSRSVVANPLTRGIDADVSVRMKTLLAPVIGIDSVDIAVSSKAAKGSETTVLDLAFCIDATGSMQPTIDAVKTNALQFFTNLNQQFQAQGKDPFSVVRIRPIFFRDYGGNYRYTSSYGYQVDKYPLGWETRPAGEPLNNGDDVPMRASATFINMVNDAPSLATFVNPEVESGGGDDPESGLECLNEAMDSPWARVGDVVTTATGQRAADEVFSVIAIWTDQNAQEPGFWRSLLNPAYPADTKMPRNYIDLKAKWDSEATIPQTNKLLTMFIPTSAPKDAWQPIMGWDRYSSGGTLTQSTSQMVSTIVNAVTPLLNQNDSTRLTQ